MKEVVRRIERLFVLPLVACYPGQVDDLGEESGVSSADVVDPPAYRSGYFWRETARLLKSGRGKRGNALAPVFASLALFPREGLKALFLLPRMLYLGGRAKELGIGHIHAHFAALPAAAAWVINRVYGITYSVTAHAYDLYQPSSLFRRKMSKALFGVTVSEFTAAAILRKGPFRRGFQWHLIRNGIPVDLFRPPPEERLQSRNRLLSVGRLIPKKGIHVLLKACAVLKDRGRVFRCRIIGDGALRASLAREAESLGLSSRICFEGVLTGAELRDAYRASDVFVLPSLQSVRGGPDTLPVVLTEAMSTGLPVVSTRVAAIPELIRNEVNGLLVPPGDPVLLAEAIDRLMEDGKLGDRLAEGAMKTVEREYDVTRTAAALASLFPRSVKNS
jgi:glycosyltransferase involved in cell wall biosynthesis